MVCPSSCASWLSGIIEDRKADPARVWKMSLAADAFSFTQVTPVPELFLTAVKLSHDNTGARYLHLAREDTNNLFRYGVHRKSMFWMASVSISLVFLLVEAPHQYK